MAEPGAEPGAEPVANNWKKPRRGRQKGEAKLGGAGYTKSVGSPRKKKKAEKKASKKGPSVVRGRVVLKDGAIRVFVEPQGKAERELDHFRVPKVDPKRITPASLEKGRRLTKRYLRSHYPNARLDVSIDAPGVFPDEAASGAPSASSASGASDS